ncbi:MAG: hypothetical protein IPL26_02660 [Leptospiraceae bacterium]|nr:hypothetical protein [Leptospiraceae bacterium]
MKKNLLIIIILSVFTNNCYTTTSEITLAANEEYQKLKDIKYEKTLGVKNAASYGFKGFYENPKSDFAISYYDSTECDTWYSEHLFWLALAIFPNREKCITNYKIESSYKNKRRDTFSFSKSYNRYYWIGFAVLWKFYSEIPDSFKGQEKTLEAPALKKIYDDFLVLERESEEQQKIAEEADRKNLESIAKAAKINVNQIIDLRNEATRDTFLLSWYNSKENPDIENNKSYSGNEFNFQEDKKEFEDYRKYKYAITDSYWVWGEYSFGKRAYDISQTNDDFVTSLNVKRDFTGTVVRLLEMKKYLNDSDTVKSYLNFSIPPDKAEQFKNEKYEFKNVIILSKFSPASLVTTGKCKYPDEYYEIRDDEYKECKERFENRKIKFKYLVGEPLKYRIVFDGEVYKNY